MHIKNIRIAGFRSYREHNFNNELSPHHNVVVGKNGSGKSNFFAAIQFVLSERFQTLSADERKSLFHEGAGKAYTMFVEITFDNADGRLAIPGRGHDPEVSIRRTIGLKQDEFRVNERKFTAMEVRQLLESAGFSSSNPYYIVEQGKIATLAHLTEDERYVLLKEIAGTKVYENRRAESMKLLDETNEKCEQIDATVSQLEGRLGQLEAETSELKQFQAADYRRRVIEYTIFDHEVESAKKALDDLDASWNKRASKTDEHRNLRATKEQELEALQAKNLRLTHEIANAEKQRQGVEREIVEFNATAKKLELANKDRRETLDRAKKEAKALSVEQAELAKALAKHAADLKSKKDQLQKRSAEAVTAADQLQRVELELASLQAKSGRKNKFKTKQEYDRWLQEEILRNEGELKAKQQLADKTAKSITDIKAAIEGEKRTLDGLRQKAQDTTSVATDDASKREDLLKQRNTLGEKRRQLWATLNEKEAALRRAADNLDSAKRVYDKAVRHDIRQGLQSLQECLESPECRDLRGSVHGQVIELMDVDPEAIMAVDVTAGNALFNVVVDSFEVSSRLLRYMNDKKKPGRVTYFPLDLCNSHPMKLPSNAHMSPLLQHAKFDGKFSSIFSELFGKTMLIRNLEDGPKVVKEFDCSAVTYDGDQFSRKGGVTGGFIDVRSKYRAATGYEQARAAVETARAAVDAVKTRIVELEQQVAAVLSQLDAIGSRAEAQRFADANADIRSSEERLARLNQSLQQAEQSKETIERAKPQVASIIEALKREKAQDLKLADSLTAAEEAQMEKLQRQVAQLRVDSSNRQAVALQLQTECQMLEDTASHLERRAHAVRDRLKVVNASASDAEDREAQLVASDLEEAQSRLKSVEDAIQSLRNEKRDTEAAVQALAQSLAQLTVSGQSDKDAVDRIHNQRALLLKRKDDAVAGKAKLGSVLLSDITASLKNSSVEKLMQLLKGANDELKKFAHVNKKALDQYSQLRDAFQEMQEKRDALRKERESVQGMISHLDKQKGEAIERTFKQVQTHFGDVFKELVVAEGSKAELSLVLNDQRGATERYSAVRIEVNFGAGTANAELAQLSGGQKSLVALALIFAIQRSDPAPFYLFDEVDAALDAEYRASVARLIQKQSAQCQFITATFKHEMLDVANTIFGIFFQNKVSTIKSIDRATASDLLRQAADERKRDREDPLEMPRRTTPAAS